MKNSTACHQKKAAVSSLWCTEVKMTEIKNKNQVIGRTQIY